MSTAYENFKGSFVAVAKIKAEAGKTEAVVEALSAVKASATSDAEPGCLAYHVVRFEDEFIVWEK